MKIIKYSNKYKNKVLSFYNDFFKRNNRLELIDSEDLLNIEKYYLSNNGCFWILLNDGNVVGGIGLGMHHNVWMVRRFFIHEKQQKMGYGTKMLSKLLSYAIKHTFEDIYLGCMYQYVIANKLYEKYGFVRIDNSIGSKADFVMKKCLLTSIIKDELTIIKKNNRMQLVLNPVENYPFCNLKQNLFMENYYVSSKEHKNKNDIIIFGGREPYTLLQKNLVKMWQKYLKTNYIDIKALSGLNAHLSLMLTMKTLYPNNNKCMLLPIDGGGHYLTKSILESIGYNVIDIPLDYNNHSVDKKKTLSLIETQKPNYIFIDRSEGLYYEDFSFLKNVKAIKIFDASQYLADIICDDNYEHPFAMGFDIIVSTTHKNYPGYQKAIICFKNKWLFQSYCDISKKYFSSIDARSFVNTSYPLLEINALLEYQKRLKNLTTIFDQKLRDNGLNAIKRKHTKCQQEHIWITFKSDKEAYNFFRKLERNNILVNYRKLPYNIGYGLRIGIENIVSRGAKEEEIDQIAKLFGDLSKGTRKESDIIKDVKAIAASLKI